MALRSFDGFRESDIPVHRIPRKRGRPPKKGSNRSMAAPTQSIGETTITVVPTQQLIQVTPTTTVQLSPDNSVDSNHSITIGGHQSIQAESEQVLSSDGNSCDEAVNTLQTDEESPDAVEAGHYITVTASNNKTGEELCSKIRSAFSRLQQNEIKPETASETGSDDVTHSYVQYVEGTAEQTIYTTTNGQMYPVYTVGESGAMYTSTGQYYSGNTTPVTYTQVGNGGGNGGGGLLSNTAYLIQQGVDAEHAIIGTRASPQTVAAVQWLLENYETAEGVSLPRSTLYNHYLRHCYDNKLDPVNAASFGKLIRSVFLGLRTRRLGTRGNSKYHYYGIRVKAGSVLTQMLCSSDEIGSNSGGSRAANNNNYNGKRGYSNSRGIHPKTESQDSTHASTLLQTQNQEFLGDGSGAIPEFPEIDLPSGCSLPGLCTLEDIDTFRSIYREHCEAFLDAIGNLEFATIESLWREFWRCQDNNNGEECEEEKYLSKTKLLTLCKFRPIQEFVKRVDFQFYQNLVQVLIPDVLRPIPSSLTQAIRNFAKGLESWMTSAMQGCPTDMVDIKVGAVCAFAQTLRRYTSLNHLAQAARAVLQNSVQINQMLTDLNRVDFHNVQEQASWVCGCDVTLVARLEADFKSTLQQHNSLEQWASWLKAVVNTVLKPYQGRPNFTTAARQLLLKWSFYSSMVIRDLTLRSAASFGSFHLIRLLYDEYMFYLIEHQVALATGETPIAVMGEKNCGAQSPVVESLNNGSSTEHLLSAEVHLSKRIKMS